MEIPAIVICLCQAFPGSSKNLNVFGLPIYYLLVYPYSTTYYEIHTFFYKMYNKRIIHTYLLKYYYLNESEILLHTYILRFGQNFQTLKFNSLSIITYVCTVSTYLLRQYIEGPASTAQVSVFESFPALKFESFIQFDNFSRLQKF